MRRNHWKYRHGFAGAKKRHPLYGRWGIMIQRCSNPKFGKYRIYGARGITVCDRWRDFVLFLADMGSTYKPGLTLERKDNDGAYSPENCIWATPKVQARNTSRNTVLTAFGKTQTVSEWCEEYGIRPSTFSYRLGLGWTTAKILTVPVKHR